MDPFLLRVLLAFGLATAALVLTIRYAQKEGATVGAQVSTLPIQQVVAFTFIAINEGVAGAVEGGAFGPVANAGIVAFSAIAVLVMAGGASLPAALAAGLGGWALVVLVPAVALPPNLVWTTPLFLAISTLAYWRLSSLERAERSESPFKNWEIVAQGCVAGALVALGLLVARHVDPALGMGIALFPSKSLVNVVSFTTRAGLPFAAEFAREGSLLFTSSVAFAFVATLLLPVVGLAPAVVLALAVAATVSHAVRVKLLPWLDRKPAFRAPAPSPWLDVAILVGLLSGGAAVGAVQLLG